MDTFNCEICKKETSKENMFSLDSRNVCEKCYHVNVDEVYDINDKGDEDEQLD